MSQPRRFDPIDSTATMYVEVNVDDAPSDPTSDVVEFAFTAPGVDVDTGASWHTGAWKVGAVDPYVCRVLVGPSGVETLANGTYAVWVRINHSPEIIVERVGLLPVT